MRLPSITASIIIHVSGVRVPPPVPYMPQKPTVLLAHYPWLHDIPRADEPLIVLSIVLIIKTGRSSSTPGSTSSVGHRWYLPGGDQVGGTGWKPGRHKGIRLATRMVPEKEKYINRL